MNRKFLRLELSRSLIERRIGSDAIFSIPAVPLESNHFTNFAFHLVMTQDIQTTRPDSTPRRTNVADAATPSSETRKSANPLLQSTAGAWANTVDCDQLLSDIYASRAEVTETSLNA